MKMEYTIIENRRLQWLIDTVNTNLKNGWKCQGGIFYVLGQREFYAQAMIKEDNE